ncbi:hypothetical protein JXB41_00100 [Candidatus Woesearchaeota archaeon]|nr:hypothetical protein [Candidatus Woesearchaeota archaeon]
MKNKKNINNQKINKESMEKKEKRIFKGLQYLMRNSRNKIMKYKTKNGKFPHNDKLLKAFKKLGYADYSMSSAYSIDKSGYKILEFYDMCITTKGYNKFCELREKYRYSWAFKLSIIAIILSILALLVDGIPIIIKLIHMMIA